MVTTFTALATLIRFLLPALLGASVSLVVLSPAALVNQRLLDPFLPYADLLLAEPPNELVQRGFECQVEIAPTFAWKCISQPVDGKFSEIRATISYGDGHKRLLTFRPRQNTVLIGDLILLWGKPQIRVDADHTYFNWPDAQARAIVATDHKRYSYFQSVSFVAVTFQLADSK